MNFKKNLLIISCAIPLIGIAQNSATNQNDNIDQLNTDLKALEVQLESLKSRQAELLGEQIPGSDVSIGLTMKLSAMLSKPVVSGLDYAIQDPGATGDPYGKMERVEAGEYWGARAELFSSDSSLPVQFGLRASWVSGDSDAYVENSGAGDLWHTRMHSDSVIDSEITSADAHYEFDYLKTDFILKKELSSSETFTTEFNGGISIAGIDQNFYVDYVDGGNSARFQEINKLRGAGPFLGTAAQWNLGWGFSVDGSAGASLVIANIEYETGDDVFYTSSDYEYEIVPVLNFDLGLGWNIDLGEHWNTGIRVAYEAENWINAYHSVRTVDDVDEGKITQTQSDIALHSLIATFAVGCTF